MRTYDEYCDSLSDPPAEPSDEELAAIEQERVERADEYASISVHRVSGRIDEFRVGDRVRQALTHDSMAGRRGTITWLIGMSSCAVRLDDGEQIERAAWELEAA